MDNDEKEMKELLKKVDDLELVPDEELENMDFYQLSYYMQTLNQLDALGNDEEVDDDEWNSSN